MSCQSILWAGRGTGHPDPNRSLIRKLRVNDAASCDANLDRLMGEVDPAAALTLALADWQHRQAGSGRDPGQD